MIEILITVIISMKKHLARASLDRCMGHVNQFRVEGSSPRKSGKEEIIRITTRLLGLEEPLPADAADAAAIAITHVIRSTLQSKFMSNLTPDDSNLGLNKSALTPNQQKIIELQKKSRSSKFSSKRSNLQDWLIHRSKP